MQRNEADTRADLIDPILRQLGWGAEEGTRITREYRIAPGRLLGGGKRAKALKADYLLWHNNRKVAVIEAKAENLPLTEGLAQAKTYATKLGVRYTYSTNGHGFYQVDMETGVEGEISKFPTPTELWAKTNASEPDWKRRLLDIAFENVGGTHGGATTKKVPLKQLCQRLPMEKTAFWSPMPPELARRLFHSKWRGSCFRQGGTVAVLSIAAHESCFWRTAILWPTRPTTSSLHFPKTHS